MITIVYVTMPNGMEMKRNKEDCMAQMIHKNKPKQLMMIV